MTLRVALQHPEGFVRDGLARLLALAEGVHVVSAVATAEELAAVCRVDVPEAVVVGTRPGTPALPTPIMRLLDRSPSPRVVLVHREPSAPDWPGLHAAVGRHEGVTALLAALRGPPTGAATPPAPGAPGTAALSRREVAVLELVAAGCTTQQAGDLLGVSPKTIETHLARAYRKLGTSNRAQAVAVALASGQLGRPLRGPTG